MLEPLYKYVTVSGLINILETGKLKWSSPKTFNDPFDLQINLLDYDLDEFRSIAEKKVSQIVFDIDKPPERTNQRVLTLRRKRVNDPNLKKEDLDLVIKGICDDLLSNELEWREGSTNDLGLGKARVLCLSQIHNDILMWGHYTDNHKGGTIKFKAGNDLILGNEEIYSISYSEERPDKDFPSEFLDRILNINSTEFDVVRYLFTKSKHWEYEKEWRLIRVAANKDDAEFHDFPPIALEAIYLGCKISHQDKVKVQGLLKDKFSHVKVFQASTNSKRYELDFSLI